MEGLRLRTQRTTPLGSTSFIFMRFSSKIGQIMGLASLPLGLVFPIWEISDPSPHRHSDLIRLISLKPDKIATYRLSKTRLWSPVVGPLRPSLNFLYNTDYRVNEPWYLLYTFGEHVLYIQANLTFLRKNAALFPPYCLCIVMVSHKIMVYNILKPTKILFNKTPKTLWNSDKKIWRIL